MSDEDLSLGETTAVHLDVHAVSAVLAGHGVHTATLRTLCAELLKDEEIEVLDEPDDAFPTLQLIVIDRAGESDVSDAVAVCVYLTLQQSVLVERIDRHMRLPTWSTLDLQVQPASRVVGSTHNSLHTVMNHFLSVIQKADAKLAS